MLAYSTISQLGYMVFGLGIGAFTAALFHLMTHAFFKALLFLGSGSVIHGAGTQDIREMGGLKSRMRVTYLTFLIGTLALAGDPPVLRVSGARTPSWTMPSTHSRGDSGPLACSARS